MNEFFQIAILLIVLLLFALIFVLVLVWSAKGSLLKGRMAWSAKKLPLRRKKGKQKGKHEGSFLTQINDASTEFLKSHLDETKE
tara:strand:- start:123 stop:374 length:252 start_codon:yes stop_codon:yes gene_type:complete